jgi:hypothetical protein
LSLDKRRIDVADGDEVLACIDQFGRVVHPHAAEADDGKVEGVRGSPFEPRGAEDVRGDDHGAQREFRAVCHEIPASEVSHWRVLAVLVADAGSWSRTIQLWHSIPGCR